MEIIIATGNKGKMTEFARMLSPAGFKLLSLDDLGFGEEIAETGQTFEENAFIKAFHVSRKFKKSKPILADDSGLCVDVLDGKPGLYSSRFGGDITNLERVEKLLDLMSDVPVAKRSAHFVCCLCFIADISGISSFEQAKKAPGQVFFFSARCNGSIAFSKRGTDGFGYDQIFSINGKTLAEMASDEKDTVSARAKALKKFVAACGQIHDE
ncbi:MAG: RdgB/HAM1 family non-canonical purine NTP pyrophosphatase [Oscillospiraceae bacterium]|nr:RdgB/HAM1 family non-canonical purine NTP pyrophosphatase [Oscillospiraceae bacterium]